MLFSWIVVFLGVFGVLVVVTAEWATTAPIGETGHAHHHLRWYSGLPLLAWLLVLVVVAYPAFNT